VASAGPVGIGLLMALASVVPPIASEVVMPLAGYVASTGRG
jgi:membrane protein DedA with SNARE-associated domain